MQHGKWVSCHQWRGQNCKRSCKRLGHEHELDWRKRLAATGQQLTLGAALALKLTPEQLAGEELPALLDEDDGAVLLPPPESPPTAPRRRRHREPLSLADFTGLTRRRDDEREEEEEAPLQEDADVIDSVDDEADDSSAGGGEEGGDELPDDMEGGPEVDLPPTVNNLAPTGGEAQASARREYWRVVRHSSLPAVGSMPATTIYAHVYTWYCVEVRAVCSRAYATRAPVDPMYAAVYAAVVVKRAARLAQAA
jgi:hypothetical protein